MFGKCLKAREESHRVRLDPDRRERLSKTAGRPSVVRGTQLSSLIILALFNVVLVDYEREPMIKEGKSGVKM